MKYGFILLLTMFAAKKLTIFDFHKECSLKTWRVVDDGVMGGMSQGDFRLNGQGHAVFSGDVSLENYGGFSSVRHRLPQRDIRERRRFKLRLKGDGKRYQFRAKSSRGDWHSYIYYFETSGNWQTIDIPFSDMSPSFRGRQLDTPNYPGETLSEVAFLIANKKAESFRLEIDKIELE